MASPEGKLAINLATLRNGWTFAQMIEGCARHGIRHVAPWRDMVAETGLAEAKRILDANGMHVTGHCRGGMFTSDGAIEDNRRAIDEAAALDAEALVLVVGALPPGSRDIAGARQAVADGIAAVLPHARTADVMLAIEPLHPMYAADRAVINTIAQALDLCAALGDGVGVAIDTYHCWWDPNLADSIARAGREGRILGHHISDFLNPTKDMLLDRGMMGDGVIDFRAFRAMIEDAGYQGPQEVEIFSRDDWWKRPGDEVLSTCVERFALHCQS